MHYILAMSNLELSDYQGIMILSSLSIYCFIRLFIHSILIYLESSIIGVTITPFQSNLPG